MKLKPGRIASFALCTTVPVVASVLAMVDAPAFATTFSSGGQATQQVFCDMPEIRGQFGSTESRYTSRGTCVELEGHAPVIRGDEERNEFDDYSRAKELFRVGWTAEAGYNPATKEAWEKLAFPAPTIDQRVPAGRPFGRFESRMVCATDPWLEFGAAHCTGIVRTANGSLGDLDKWLRIDSQPMTSRMKLVQTQALYDSHEAFVKRFAAMAPKATTTAKEALRTVTLPDILEPRPGSTHPAQTPMKIRVVAPRDVKVEVYEVEFQTREANADWRPQTTVRVRATDLEGPLGYTGWGYHDAGTGTQMTATLGLHRLRARAVSPVAGEPGTWREFTVAGDPGLGAHVVKNNGLQGFGHAGTAAPVRGPTATTLQAPPSVRSTTLDWNNAARR